MEAKLKYAQLDCYNKSFERTLRKEESQDSVVPDTLPDISNVLYTLGSLLIRSKDVNAGRVKLEANIPAKVVFCAEDGGIYSLDVTVPVYLSADDEKINDGSLCTAEMKLIALETRLLNPRKVLVKAEVAAEVCCYDKAHIEYAEDVEEQEHIHVKHQLRELSFISAVTEKTFALTDEQALPAGMESADILSSNVEVFTDDVKQLGSKLIVKGRAKSHLLVLAGTQVMPLEATTDYSQIIECGGGENASASVWMIPSGAYHYISSESGEKRLCMEFHMVAQAICSEVKIVECLVDAYSNEYELELKHAEIVCEKTLARPFLRSSARQLFQMQGVADVISCNHIWGMGKANASGITIPVSIQCVYADEDAKLKSERFDTELGFDVAVAEGEKALLKSVELSECSLATLPGGVELRVSAQAEPVVICTSSFGSINSVCFDETQAKDNSDKPSIVLLRASSGDDLWTLARENCSTVEDIIQANHLQDSETPWEKLILIPKSF